MSRGEFSDLHSIFRLRALRFLVISRCTNIYNARATAIFLLNKPFVWRRSRRRCCHGLRKIPSHKPRRRRQRERHKTKGLLGKTMAVHVRYKSLYISLLSSEKQERDLGNANDGS